MIHFREKQPYIGLMDIVSPEVRSRMMAAVRSKNTSLERVVFAEMRRRGVQFRKHARSLPGSPDLVVPLARKAVFVDGDFWHGYRYPAWKGRIKSKFWRSKIEANRLRDRRNFRRLRRLGWKVMRVWGHEIKEDPAGAFQKIHDFLLS